MGWLLVRIMTLLCIAFFLLIIPCVALHINVPPLTSPPRKVMPVKQVQALKTEKTAIVPEKKTKEATIGGSLQPKETKMKQIKGESWRKWEEVSEPSDLFTMDYRRVRKRQPIHNKSLPIP